jgi:hypothetical protein
MVGTAFGALAFLSFLALATYVLVGLYATSVITSVAWDNARLIAEHPSNNGVAEQAQSDASRRLRGFKHVDIDVSETSNDVALHISADRPVLLPAALVSTSGINRINRTVHVRPERMQ